MMRPVSSCRYEFLNTYSKVCTYRATDQSQETHGWAVVCGPPSPLALGDSAPGVSSAGPIQIMFMFGLSEPKGCSLDKCRPKCCMGRSQPPRNRAGLVPGTPFSGEPVEAQKVTGLMSLLVHVVLSLTAWHHRAHFWNLQALQSTVPPSTGS